MKFSLLDQLTKKADYTESELQQANLYKDYLASSKTNSDLESFLRKALENNMADKIAEQRDKELESDYEKRKRSLIYV